MAKAQSQTGSGGGRTIQSVKPSVPTEEVNGSTHAGQALSPVKLSIRGPGSHLALCQGLGNQSLLLLVCPQQHRLTRGRA